MNLVAHQKKVHDASDVNLFAQRILQGLLSLLALSYKGHVCVFTDICVQVHLRLTDLSVSHADEPLIHQLVSFGVSGLTLHNVTLCRLVC